MCEASTPSRVSPDDHRSNDLYPETRSGRLPSRCASRSGGWTRQPPSSSEYRRTGFRKRPTITRRGEEGGLAPAPCYTTLPSAVLIAPFAFLATWVVARNGYRRDEDAKATERSRRA
jgi:hypothetical protein